MNILTVTTLFPNNYQPRHGIFVEQRLGKLVESGRVQSRIIAPVPWFPFRNRCFGRYSLYADVPVREQRNGLEVIHPRFISIPGLSMYLAPLTLARAMYKAAAMIRYGGYDFDLIDAHYYYPDGIAAVMLARKMGKPVVVTARGSDLNVFLGSAIPRAWIMWAERHVNATITVSAALKDRFMKYGVSGDRINVLRNGVDVSLFRPVDRELVRKELGIEGRLLLSVGNLIEGKGHHIAIAALTRLPEIRLVVIGEGEERDSLEKLAIAHGVKERVTFRGNLPQEQLREYYSAADALVLASAREGMPNVLLEAMACGTPVVATPVGGIPEIVCSPDAGIVTGERSVDAFADAINKLFSRKIDRDATRNHAKNFNWDDTTQGQIELFNRITASR